MFLIILLNLVYKFVYKEMLPYNLKYIFLSTMEHDVPDFHRYYKIITFLFKFFKSN